MMINPIAMFDYKPGHGVPAYPFISFTLIGRESGMSTKIEGLVDSGADATMDNICHQDLRYTSPLR